jgi:hypothetical protein
MRYFVVGLLTLTLTVMVIRLTSADAGGRGRSFEECQARAVALGIQPSRTTRVFRKYLRYKAAGTAIKPRGVVARCMAGLD